jgi:hypothetical protein
MKTVELFCGTKSFSKVAASLNHSTLTFDNDPQHNPDVCCDIMDVKPIENIDVIWASPPCTSFSVAALWRHWDKETGLPKSENAKLGLKMLDKTVQIIAQSKPKVWYIENPRGKMRKWINGSFIKHGITNYVRHTITYCQYETHLPAHLRRMKPTDIWTNNLVWKPRPMCKNGSPCHEASPRGSNTGTQRIRSPVLRSTIPEALFLELFGARGDEQ